MRIVVEMIPDIVHSTVGERFLALGIVLLIALITFFLGRTLAKRLKGSTRLGLHGLERLSAPMAMLVLAVSAIFIMRPIAGDPDVLTFAAEVVAIVGGFWLFSRSLDVFWTTGEHSVRLRHNAVARAALLSMRNLGKVMVWVGAAITVAVKFGAAGQLYLLLGGVGAGLAFAARDPLRNAFAFGNMVVDPPFRLGDRVRLEEFRGGIAAEGTVLSITLSHVTLETRGHTRVHISNVRVGDLRVENLSAADRRRLELVVPVPRELKTETLREACDLIEADLRAHPDVSDALPPHVWMAGSPGGLQLKASLWLRKATSRREAQRDLILLIRDRLERPLREREARRVTGRAVGDPVRA